MDVELRRRKPEEDDKMSQPLELAPIASLRETDIDADFPRRDDRPMRDPDVEEFPEGGSEFPVARDDRGGGRRGGGDEGIDDGLIPPSNPPVRPNGGFPPSDPPSRTPRRGGGGYFPLSPSGPTPRFGPGKPGLDVNLYATKKTVAQGMMDIALLTANANQLRYVIDAGVRDVYFYINVTLICLSITMQLIVGIALIFIGRYNVHHDHHASRADRLNNIIVLCVFLITVINVFISSFGVEPDQGFGPDHSREPITG